MGSRSKLAVCVVTVVSIATASWASDTATQCCSKRLRVSGSRMKQLFRCHAKAAVAGAAVDPACVAAVGDALERSFARAECPGASDGPDVRADLERIASGAAGLLRPTSVASACAARKLKLAGRFASATQRATARFAPLPGNHLAELGPVVTQLLVDLQSGFARLEERTDCLTTGDATTVGARISAGEHASPPDGLLLATFRLCPVCGDGARGGTEQCDGLDGSACSGACRSDCTCPICGDGVMDQTTEACDGADAAACQGLCRTDCTCPTPVCGNGVKEAGEACDGTAVGACGSCQPDCTCGPAVCGNGIVESPEQCDGVGCFNGLTGCSESCTCCGYPCYEFGCCDPDEVCMPSPSTGYCFKFRCDPGESCNFGYQCTQFGTLGSFCAGLPGSLCLLPDFGGGTPLPCVAPGSCQNGTCCLPAGEPCSGSSTCCSHSCDAGSGTCS